MNPYQFVPFAEPAELKPVVPHEKIDGSLNSGVLRCRLTALTEFFVSGPQERVARDQHQRLQFCRDSGTPIIPGSSLKGSIRSVFEALSGSCLSLAGDVRKRRVRNDILSYWDKRRQHDYQVPDGFAPCGMRNEFKQKKKACPACRVFGLLYSGEVHLGRVHFSDARLVSDTGFREITLEPFGAPGPRHRTFYGTPESGNQIARGRKFYYHRVQGARTTSEKTGQNKTVEASLPGSVFEFTVEYHGLRDDELILLVYSLILEEPMRHKMGMGKGVGLGSVKIEITGWQKLDMEKRYQNPGTGFVNVSADQLELELQNVRKRYHESFSYAREAFEALRDIWTWDEDNPRDPQYPSYMWFKENRNVPLEEVPDDAGQYKVRPSAAPRGSQRSQPEPSRSTSSSDAATLKQLQKQRDKQKQQEALFEVPYQDREVEKVTILEVSEATFAVSLPKIKGKTFEVKKKNPYRRYKVGSKIRVRVHVNAASEITRVEEA